MLDAMCTGAPLPFGVICCRISPSVSGLVSAFQKQNPWCGSAHHDLSKAALRDWLTIHRDDFIADLFFPISAWLLPMTHIVAGMYVIASELPGHQQGLHRPLVLCA